MRRSIALAILLMLTACDGGDRDDDSLLVESVQIQSGASGDCEVVGTVFNTDGERDCDGCVFFDALDGSGAIIDESTDCFGVVPSNDRVSYRATFTDTPCSAVRRAEQTGLTDSCD